MSCLTASCILLDHVRWIFLDSLEDCSFFFFREMKDELIWGRGEDVWEELEACMEGKLRSREE